MWATRVCCRPFVGRRMSWGHGRTRWRGGTRSLSVGLVAGNPPERRMVARPQLSSRLPRGRTARTWRCCVATARSRVEARRRRPTSRRAMDGGHGFVRLAAALARFWLAGVAHREDRSRAELGGAGTTSSELWARQAALRGWVGGDVSGRRMFEVKGCKRVCESASAEGTVRPARRVIWLAWGQRVRHLERGESIARV